jgi:hypothetical protein
LTDGTEEDPKLNPPTAGAGAGAGAAVLVDPKGRTTGSWVAAGVATPKVNEEEGAVEPVELLPEPNAKVPGLVVEDAKLGPVGTSALDWKPEPSAAVLGIAPKEKPLNTGVVALVAPLVPNKRGGGIPILDPNEVRPPPLPSAPMGTAM